MTIEQIQKKIAPHLTVLNTLLFEIQDEVSKLNDKDSESESHQEKLYSFEEAEHNLDSAIDSLQSI